MNNDAVPDHVIPKWTRKDATVDELRTEAYNLWNLAGFYGREVHSLREQLLERGIEPVLLPIEEKDREGASLITIP